MTKYTDDIPTAIQEKLAELVELIEDDNKEDISSYISEANKWQSMYYESINEPCQHLRTRVEKSDKVRVICKCCSKVTYEFDDFESAAKGLSNNR
tara:strand:+ start:280 stop:564 length:285 start_codon:yes stop_codon:yes gene_type:complete